MSKTEENLQDYNDIFATNSFADAEDKKDPEYEDKESVTDPAPSEQNNEPKEADQEEQTTEEKEGKAPKKEKGDAEHWKKRADELSTWGHKKNMAYINARKKVSGYLDKLATEGTLAEEDKSAMLNMFDTQGIEDEENIEESTQANPFVELKGKLDKEFSIFKKYAKLEEADEKYNSFFYFWPMMNSQEQEATLTYLEEESPEVVLDKIMATGSELYENIFKGMTKQGGILPYMKTLTSENKKLAEKVEKLETELDSTAGQLYNRSISSKTSSLKNQSDDRSYDDILKNG